MRRIQLLPGSSQWLFLESGIATLRSGQSAFLVSGQINYMNVGFSQILYSLAFYKYC